MGSEDMEVENRTVEELTSEVVDIEIKLNQVEEILKSVVVSKQLLLNETVENTEKIKDLGKEVALLKSVVNQLFFSDTKKIVDPLLDITECKPENNDQEKDESLNLYICDRCDEISYTDIDYKRHVEEHETSFQNPNIAICDTPVFTQETHIDNKDTVEHKIVFNGAENINTVPLHNNQETNN